MMQQFTLRSMISLSIILFYGFSLFGQNCPSTTLTSQAEIFSFYCDSVDGDLIIDDSFSGSIVDLDPLNTIQSISGDLIVRNCPQLGNLQGLDVITSIGGDLIIQDCGGITSMGNFPFALESIGGDFIFLNNASFGALAMNNLSTVGGIFEIKDNQQMSSIQFAGLTSIGSEFRLTSNTFTSLNFSTLQSIGGIFRILACIASGGQDLSTFSLLNSVGADFTIQDNQGINSLDGFGNLTNFNSGFYVINNDFLQSIDGFSGISTALVVVITGNLELSSIDGLISLSTIFDDLRINNNGGISSLNGFSNLTNISGDLEIVNNQVLSSPPSLGSNNSSNSSLLDLNGFSSLSTIGGDLDIRSNSIINSISGFSSLQSSSNIYLEDNIDMGALSGFDNYQNCGNNLLVRNNSALQTINGFSSLTTVGNTFRLDNNDACTSISGFDNLTSTGDEFNINWNQILTQINGFNNLTTVPGYFNITFNDGITTINGFQNLNTTEKVRIHTNPQLNSVTGFENISTLTSGMDLYNNSVLSMCCWVSPLYQALPSNPDVNIFNNATGCNSFMEMGGAAPTLSCGNPPSFSTGADDCLAQFAFDDPVATDDCIVSNYVTSLVDANGTVVYTNVPAISGASFNYSLPVGDNILTYIAEDGFGNTSSCQIILEVVDDIDPVWDLAGSSLILTGECGIDDPLSILASNAPQALDNCSTVIVESDSQILTGSCGNETIYTDTYTAIDASGNMATPFVVSLTMVDTEDPVLLGGIPDVTINCGDTYPSIPAITAFDNCAGDLTMAIIPNSTTSPGDCMLGSIAEINTMIWTVDDGCGNTTQYTWTVTVTNDFDVDLGPDVIECNSSSYQITAPAGSSYVWSTGATTQSITVTADDNYEVTVTSTNGCCSIDDINVVFSTGPAVTATGGVIDCSGTATMITANSSVGGSTFNWAGPGGFNSTDQSPQITETGTYTVIVTDPNGCTSSTTAEVTPDTNVPDLVATGGVLDCMNTSISLSSTSSSGTTFAWSGPGGFSSTMQNPSVTTAGSYTVIVTAANGCTNATSVTVEDDTNSPIVNLTSSNELSCLDNEAVLSATSSDNMSQYNWSGPNAFTGNTASVTVMMAGTYTLTTTASNGCTSMNNIDVDSDNSVPTINATGGELNCATSIIMLDASSNSNTVTYAWSGPDNFNATIPNPNVSLVGTYTLVITETNGCTATTTVEVTEDSTPPTISSTNGVINCTSSSVSLSATSSDTESTYQWSGPNGFSATTAIADVSVAGTYQVIVTAANGCTASTTSEVTIDITEPSLSISNTQVNCTEANITITADYAAQAAITWTGPNGFISEENTIVIDMNGVYEATIIDNENGCSSTSSIEVDEDFTLPTAAATGGVISCTETNIQLTATSNIDDATYQWVGPGGYSSILQNPSVDEEGIYTLVVTSSNGCTAQATAEVSTDSSLPNANVSGENLTCTISQVDLIGTTTTTGATGSWTGPDNFESQDDNITVAVAGIYSYTVVSENGCSITASYEVLNDTDLPEGMIITGEVDCDDQSQVLELDIAESSTVVWTGPNGFSSSNTDISVSDNGVYSAFIVGSNGCTTTIEYNIDLIFDYNTQINTVDATDTNDGSAEIVLSGGQSPFNIIWDNGQTGFNATDLEPGIHTVQVTDGNGCTSTFEFTIATMTFVTDDADDFSILVYPNPVMEQLFIDRGVMDIESVMIFDNQGRLMKNISVNNMNEIIELDCKDLASGMYNLVLSNRNKIVNVKITKAH